MRNALTLTTDEVIRAVYEYARKHRPDIIGEKANVSMTIDGGLVVATVTSGFKDGVPVIDATE